MPNDHVPATDTGLPDDPREACQQAISLLIKAELSDARMNVRAFATLIEESTRGDHATHDPVMYAIDVAAMRLLESFSYVEQTLDRTAALCRHGTGKYDHTGERRAGA